MSSQRFKYVKIRSSTQELRRTNINIPKLPFSILSSILLVVMFSYLFIPMFQSLSIKSKVDPNIYTVLDNGLSAKVLISGYNLHLSNCLKTWEFGNLTICEAQISSKSELETLAYDKKVISIYLINYKAMFPMFNISKDSLEEYKEMYYVDIDNKFVGTRGIYTGKGVTVAVIDTGIDYLHPDFYRNNIIIIKALVSCIYKVNGSCLVVNTSGYNYTQMKNIFNNIDSKYKNEYGEYAFEDENGHGTHVAGIIAGQGTASNGLYKGIAPGVQLVIVKAFHSNGAASLENILDALEWIYNNSDKYNISIVSCSWGADIPSMGNDPITLAINKLVKDKHLIVVVAAGNAGNIPGDISVPAISPYVVTVGAWDPYLNKLAWFSSLGPTRNLEMKPDFVAPGVMIVAPKSEFAEFPSYLLVDNGSYVALSGTSMATPVVSGCIADFIQYYESIYHKKPTLEDFIKFEEVNAIRLNFKKDFITGYGIVQCPF